MKVALDTNAYSDFARGDESRLAIVQTASHLFMPFVVLGELRAGFAFGKQAASNEAVLQKFLASPRVVSLWADDMTTRHYAALITQLKKQGRMIPTNDIWIAALALQHGLTLCTSDTHFQYLPQISRC